MHLMDLMPFKDLLPVITAFGGLYVGHWLSSKNKRRESLDEWWERYAITNGTERVLDFLMLFERKKDVPSTVTDAIPQQALLHVQVLIGNDVLTEYCHGIADYFAGSTITGDYEGHKQILMDMVECVFSLETVFYDQKLKKKSDILKIQNLKQVQEVLADIEITFENHRNIIPPEIVSPVHQ